MEAFMSWLKRASDRDIKGLIRREGASGRFSEQPAAVVTNRDYPGKVTSRTIRNDVYQDALRAAESTLRNAARKK
jgi:hypothetical protein